MRASIYSFFLILLALTSSKAQVKIGDNPQNINPLSLLELESNSSALVITRISEAEMTRMAPLPGALVYNTDQECVFYYNGNEWFNLCEDEGSVNVSLEVINDELVLTDSSNNAVSILLEDLNALTFTTDAIVNPTQPIVRDSTIVITQNGTNYNFEVGEITGDNIVDSSINGFSDIQDASITANKLSDNVAGVGLIQAVNGSLNVDLSQVTGTGTLSSSGTLTILGQPMNALFNDIAIDVADNGITSAKILDGQVQTDDIADNAINNSKIADNGVTTDKIGTAGAADANSILGTDAAGDPQWQDAATLAASLGEDVSSTNGSISGTAANAALVAMDLEVNVDGTTLEVDPTNGVQIADNGITTDKIGTAGAADANSILGTDAAGDPQWQDAATLAASLGEDVSSTNGSISGTAANAALVAMDLEVNVDGTTLEVDPTNGVQIADNGVTTDKIGTAGAADANSILGTDAAGDPQWQDAATLAASLGEDVGSTNGSISGTAANAALVAMDLEVNVDGTTLEVDPTNGVQIADNGVTTDKIGTAGATDANSVLGTDAAGDPQWQDAAAIAASLGEDVSSTNGSISGTAANAALVAMDLEVNVDGTTLEVDPTNGVQIADNGVTTDKIGTAGAADANSILGTDAAGDPQWQDAATLAASLGEDVSSTNGSISGTAANAALVAMDLEVNVDGTTLEVDPTNGVQIADNGVTTDKIGTAGATDANSVLGTDAAGDPQWQDAAGIAASLGEDVSSTNGSISGTAANAALVAMDLEVNVDGTTLEVDPTNGVQIADNGVTTDKIGTAGAADANSILGTDAAGDPQWQDAAGIAASLGEDVSSTNGSISGTAANAALVAMDLEVNVDGTTLEVDPTNGVQIAAGTANQILRTNAAGTGVEWGNLTDDSVAGSVIFSDGSGGIAENNAQFFWDQTGNRLGIGTNTPAVGTKLHVANGNTRTEGILNSAGTLLNPSYGFSGDTDTNTGMYFPAQDQLGLVVGALEAINVREIGSDTETTINGSLELTEQLLDETGVAGNAGDVLTATATGTEWRAPAVVAMGKANGANSISVNGATVGGAGGGINTVTLTTARPDGDYIIQLSVVGNNKIFVTSQNAGDFTVEIRDSTTDALVIANWYFTVLDF
ncbi:hypothetical protein L0P88_02895 [Muricauda sp. SCSIO 64092]|uniref:beta strand repeat-containing protein n=1 Tax=Allomuricauda sp. SCSIO 64092 TaxID=2908842 RepID=UPI001FF5255C|nr:hypothetical protein [Muricauda sp. SCSIO 64092]UOY07509.1 hypothetical protein L0P88_02895 [Muricauda sp. SCSIO 64092]